MSADFDGRIVLRDLIPSRYGAIRRELPPFSNGELDDLAVSNDANVLFSLDSFAPARLWNLREPLTPLLIRFARFWTVSTAFKALLADNGFRAVYAMGRLPATRLEVQELKGGALRRWQVPLSDDHLGLESLQLAPGGKIFAALWRRESKIELYDLDKAVLRASLPAPNSIAGVSFAPDDSRLAVAATTGEVEIWNLAGQNVLKWDAATRSLEALAWSPDGAQLATIGDGFLTLWNASTGAENRTFTLPSGARSALAWSRDSRTLAVAHGPKTDEFAVDGLALVSAQTGKIEREIPLSGPLRAVKFSPDGAILGLNSGQRQAQLHLFRVAGSVPIAAPTDDCNVFNFTWTAPDELAIDTGGRLKVWNLAP